MKKYILAVGITIVLMFILLSQIDCKEIFEIIKKIEIRHLALGFFFYFLQYIGRTLRFALLLPNNSSQKKWNVFNIVCVHNFLNHILPARIGEGSYILLMNRYRQVSLAGCFSSLFLARLLDLISIVFFFLVALMMAGKLFYTNQKLQLIIFSIFLMAALTSALFFIKPMTELVIRFLRAIISTFFAKLPSWFVKVDNKVEELLNHFEIVKQKKMFILLNVISLGLWLCNIAMFCILVKGFGYDIPVINVALGSTGAALTNVLPINGFGSFGTLEAGWTLAFMLVGIDKTVAISTGFGIHIISFAYAAIFALFGYAGLLSASIKRSVLK